MSDLICRKRDAKGMKQVVTPNYDWCVIYLNDKKVWEGDNWGYIAECIAEELNIPFGHYEFTDEDEVDGFTPDRFSDIIGLKEINYTGSW